MKTISTVFDGSSISISTDNINKYARPTWSIFQLNSKEHQPVLSAWEFRSFDDDDGDYEIIFTHMHLCVDDSDCYLSRTRFCSKYFSSHMMCSNWFIRACWSVCTKCDHICFIKFHQFVVFHYLIWKNRFLYHKWSGHFSFWETILVSSCSLVPQLFEELEIYAQ